MKYQSKMTFKVKDLEIYMNKIRCTYLCSYSPM